MADHQRIWQEGDSEIAHLMRQKEWDETPLGPRADWPFTLKTAVNIMLNASEAIAIYWGRDYILLYNDAWRKLIGHKHPEALGQPGHEVFPEIWDQITGPFEELMTTGNASRQHEQMLALDRMPGHEDGWFNYTLNPIPDGKGGVGGIFNISTEVTEQRRAEKLLRKSEQQRRLATRAADMHLCEVDLENQTFDWSVNMSQDVNFPMPNTFREAEAIIHPEDKKRVLDTLRLKIARNRDFEVEYRVEDPSAGEVAWIYSAGTVLEKKDGTCTRLICVSKNITDRKRGELQDRFLSRLVSKMQQFEDPDEIIETVTEMLGDYMSVDRCTYAEIAEDENSYTVRGSFSRAGVELTPMASGGALSDFGKDAKELMLKKKPFIVDDISTDVRLNDSGKAVCRENDIRAFISVPRHKDGRFRAKLSVYHNQPRAWRHDEVRLLQIVAGRCREALERARITRELQEVNETLEVRVKERTKALETYQKQLQSLASELNKAEEYERQRLAEELHSNLGQMLAVGKMQLDTMQRKSLPIEIRNDLEGSIFLMSDALAYLRKLMTNLNPPPVLEEDNLADIIRWVAGQMEKHGLSTTIEEEGKPLSLEEEVITILRRAVNELLYNVVKHTDTDAARVLIRYGSESVEITVEDDGKGFDTTQDFVPGEHGGFGLFNIRERMMWIGGQFSIESDPEQGTRITLYAPLRKQPGKSLAAEETAMKISAAVPEEQPEPKKQIRVLVVDDHEMMREGLRKLIDGEDDMTVIAGASDGIEAMKLTRETNPDVIVMDLNLPGISGIEATKRILGEHPDTCIIGLSLHGRGEVDRSMKRAGAAAYVSKNEAFDSLCKTIRENKRMN